MTKRKSVVAWSGGAGVTKGNNVTFGGDGYIPGLDCGGGFKSVSICQNLANCVL